MSMIRNTFTKQIGNLAVLDEPVRRRLYLYVAGQSGDVSRDQAARATKVSRALAAFHLDKLVEAELLQAGFRRLRGRGGPGAGRPSKVYRRSSVQLDVSLPQRRYELAAHVFAGALAKTDSEAVRGALREAARETGHRLAEEAGEGDRRAEPLTRASRALEACGYEPRRASEGEDDVVLSNCPFDSLRPKCPALVCGMSLALIEGLIDGLGVEGVRARLAPRPGACCVALRREAAKG
jgi:predicted ArsR family transcriptional regulator